MQRCAEKLCGLKSTRSFSIELLGDGGKKFEMAVVFCDAHADIFNQMGFPDTDGSKRAV